MDHIFMQEAFPELLASAGLTPDYTVNNLKIGDVRFILNVLDSYSFIEAVVVVGDPIEAQEFFKASKNTALTEDATFQKGLLKRPVLKIEVNKVVENLTGYEVFNNEYQRWLLTYGSIDYMTRQDFGIRRCRLELVYDASTFQQPGIRFPFHTLQEALQAQALMYSSLILDKDLWKRMCSDVAFKDSMYNMSGYDPDYHTKMQMESFAPSVNPRDAEKIEQLVRGNVAYLEVTQGEAMRTFIKHETAVNEGIQQARPNSYTESEEWSMDC